MSTKFADYLNEQLKDDEFRKEYEALQSECASIQAVIDAQQASGMTQKKKPQKGKKKETE